jgi:hypothetical protein
LRKPLVALIGTVVIGVFATSAAASRFAFQGGDYAANRDVPVEMTMTGKTFRRPLHVTSFLLGMDLVKEDCPGYSGKDPLPLPIHQGSGGPHGIAIRRESNGQLYFQWHYTSPSGFYEELQGVQIAPRKWVGEATLDWLPEYPPGGDYHCYSNYEPQWQAKLVPR